MRRSGVKKERIGTRATLDRGAWVKNLTIKIEVKEKNNLKEKKGRIEQRKAQRRGKKQVVELFFPPQKSQTTQSFGSICYKTKLRHNNMISELNVNLT